MSKIQRRKIQAKTVNDVSSLGQISKEELLKDAEKYDKENYNPLENLDEKEVLVPENRTEVITIRLTQKENEQITKIARENGLSKSSLLRMLVTRSLKKFDFFEMQKALAGQTPRWPRPPRGQWNGFCRANAKTLTTR